MMFQSLDLKLFKFLDWRKVHFVFIPPYFNVLPLPHLHLFLYISQTKSKYAISHHLLILWEIFDLSRFKGQKCKVRLIQSSYCSGPPVTCVSANIGNNKKIAKIQNAHTSSTHCLDLTLNVVLLDLI